MTTEQDLAQRLEVTLSLRDVDHALSFSRSDLETCVAALKGASDVELLKNLVINLNRKLTLQTSELGSRRVAMDTAIAALTNAAQLVDGFRLGKRADDWSEWDEMTRRAISYSLERFHELAKFPDFEAE